MDGPLQVFILLTVNISITTLFFILRRCFTKSSKPEELSENEEPLVQITLD